MDFEFIIGILVSILLTLWGIWHANKQKTKADLTLIDREWISIIDTYDDKEKILERINYTIPFNSNQYYYRGTIINTGNVDIYKNIVMKPLKISFPEGFKILNFDLLPSASKIETNFKQELDSVTIEWDILKPLEHFTFEMIFETSKNYSRTKVDERFSLDYRIANLNKFTRMSIWGLKEIKNKKILLEYLPNNIGFTFALLFGLFLFVSGINSFKHESGNVETVITSIITKQPVEIKYYTRDSLKLVHANKSEFIAIKDLDKTVHVTVKRNILKDRYILTTISGLLAFIIIPLGIYKTAVGQVRDFKLKKVIGSL